MVKLLRLRATDLRADLAAQTNKRGGIGFISGAQFFNLHFSASGWTVALYPFLAYSNIIFFHKQEAVHPQITKPPKGHRGKNNLMSVGRARRRANFCEISQIYVLMSWIQSRDFQFQTDSLKPPWILHNNLFHPKWSSTSHFYKFMSSCFVYIIQH